MTTAQTDSHRARQQAIVENFSDLVVTDLSEAEQELEAMEEADSGVEPLTIKACRALLDEEYAVGKFWNHEHYLTECVYKHK